LEESWRKNRRKGNGRTKICLRKREALQHLADLTGKQIKIAAKVESFAAHNVILKLSEAKKELNNLRNFLKNNNQEHLADQVFLEISKDISEIQTKLKQY
jgi:Cft2 family RNA processing exonuclease